MGAAHPAGDRAVAQGGSDDGISRVQGDISSPGRGDDEQKGAAWKEKSAGGQSAEAGAIECQALAGERAGGIDLQAGAVGNRGAAGDGAEGSSSGYFENARADGRRPDIPVSA